MKLDSRTRRFDTVAVIALLSLFAATATMLILIGAKQYKLSIENMNQNYDTRTTASFLQEKIRQADAQNAVQIENFQGCDSLAFEQQIGDTTYVTYIYAYEGMLYEQFITKGASVSPATGQKIIEITSFSPTLMEKDLLKIHIVYPDQSEKDLYFHLHAQNGGSQ